MAYKDYSRKRKIQGMRPEGVFPWQTMPNELGTQGKNLIDRHIVSETQARLISRFQLPSYTTSELTQLTSTAGRLAWNTDTTSVQVYNGGSWVDVGSSSSGGGITWTEVTSDTTADGGNGYLTNSASQIVVTLPSSASVGENIKIVGVGAGGWKLAQPAGVTVYFGTSQTTSGTGGYLESIDQRDCVDVVCTTANQKWHVNNSIGNITIV